MKWFSSEEIDRDPVKRIRQCIRYLKRPGDLPERELTAALLLDTIKENPSLEGKDYEEIIKLEYYKINFYLCIHGNKEAIKKLLEFDIPQEYISCILRNKNLDKDYHSDLSGLIDNSPKGQVNRKILERLWKN